MDYDVIVLGSGPAGMAAAYGLKEAGQKVAVVESYLWGGTCPNYGCDPKKILMSAVEAQARGKALAQKGLVGETHINWEALLAFKKSYTDEIPTRQKGGLEEANITTYAGAASFVSPHALQVGEQILSAHQFLIATGQQVRQLDIPGQEYLKNSTDFMALPHLPRRVAFVGAGYIAFELATIARAAGAEVHVIHHNDRPLKGFDEELVQELVAHLQEAGIVFHFDVSLSEVQKEQAGYRLVAPDFELETDLVIGATGRTPNLGALHLERAHVDYGKNGILVNEYLQTTQPHIYACGDVLAKEAPKLTPVASYEAKYAVAAMTKATDQPLTYPLLPTVVFGDYRLARIGVSEKELAAEPTKYHSQLLDLHDWYTYFRIQDQKAKIKLVYDEADRLVAVTCFSSLADELINYFVLVLNKKISPAELSDYIFAYPGLANDLNYLL